MGSSCRDARRLDQLRGSRRQQRVVLSSTILLRLPVTHCRCEIDILDDITSGHETLVLLKTQYSAQRGLLLLLHLHRRVSLPFALQRQKLTALQTNFTAILEFLRTRFFNTLSYKSVLALNTFSILSHTVPTLRRVHTTTRARSTSTKCPSHA